MNFKYPPLLHEAKPSIEDAYETVLGVLKKAKGELELSTCQVERINDGRNIKVSLHSLVQQGVPLEKNITKFLSDTIENIWKLTPIFLYTIKKRSKSHDESGRYLYYEVVFSQPTVTYPVPQVTASVFFTIEENIREHPTSRAAPSVYFRIEGHQSDHDIRYITLTADWILALMKMKIKVFKNIEAINLNDDTNASF